MIIIEIDFIRKNIDIIDQEIMELILKRRKLVKKVGEIKNKEDMPIYVPEREQSIFSIISKNNNLDLEEVSSIFTEIISFCRVVEKKLEVGINLNPLSLIALRKMLGMQVEYSYFSKISDFLLKKLNYILINLEKSPLDILIKNEWKIINRVSIENKVFYLFTNYKLSNFKNVDFVILKDNKLEIKRDIEEINMNNLIGTLPKK